MTLILLIAITVVVALLAVIFTIIYLFHRKNNSSGAALASVFWVAALFSGAILGLYCADSHELTLSDILSFYGTIASVLASAYLGYVVYKIEKDEVCRNNSCCCIINKITVSEDDPGEVDTVELRRVSNDIEQKPQTKKASHSYKDAVGVEEQTNIGEVSEIIPFIPDKILKTLVIVGRGYTKFPNGTPRDKLKEYMASHPTEKQPAIMLFSVENHGPAFLQSIRFSFGAGVEFSTALILANEADHKCKWLFLPAGILDGHTVTVTFTSCYGDKTYADLKLEDLFAKTSPGLFYSCKYYHYHGSKKPTNIG